MSTIPFHFQRRFEQRWATRHILPVKIAKPSTLSFQAKTREPSPLNRLASEPSTREVPRLLRSFPWL